MTEIHRANRYTEPEERHPSNQIEQTGGGKDWLGKTIKEHIKVRHDDESVVDLGDMV